MSRQAVGRALERGRLVLDSAGKLDPTDPTNAAWCARHAAGIDDAYRAYRPGRIAVDGVLTDAEIDGLLNSSVSDAGFANDDAADDGSAQYLFRHWGDVQIDSRKADELLARCYLEHSNPVAFLVASLEYLRDRIEKLEAKVGLLTG